MKTIRAAFLLATLCAALQMNAQSPIQPTDATFEFDKAERPCIQANLDPEPKTLKKAWREFLKDNYDFKLKGIGFLSNKDLLSAEEVKVEKLSSKQMDFYTYIVEDDNGSEMKVFVRYGYDIYLTKENNPDEYETLTTMLEEFMKQYLPSYYEDRVKDTEKRIENLSDEKKDLEKDIADDSAEIAKLKKEIKDLEGDLKSNSEKLESANTKLKKRSEKLKRIKDQLKDF